MDAKHTDKWMEGFVELTKRAGVSAESVPSLLKTAERLQLMKNRPDEFNKGFDSVVKSAAGLPSAGRVLWTGAKGLGLLAGAGLGADWALSNVLGPGSPLETDVGANYAYRKMIRNQQRNAMMERMRYMGLSPEARRAEDLRQMETNLIHSKRISDMLKRYRSDPTYVGMGPGGNYWSSIG